jgi:hypothetical protein
MLYVVLLSAVMLNVIMGSVVRLSVIKVSVVMLSVFGINKISRPTTIAYSGMPYVKLAGTFMKLTPVVNVIKLFSSSLMILTQLVFVLGQEPTLE